MLKTENMFEIRDSDNPDMRKVREVIYRLGLEDEMIVQKIKVYNLKCKKYIKGSDKSENISNSSMSDYYDDILTHKLKLLTIHRNMFSVSYEKAKKIIIEYKLKTKKEYYELCERNVRLSKDPELLFKGKWKNWVDYLSIPDDIYYNKNQCKEKIREYMNSNTSLKNNYMLNSSDIIEELCKLDEKFPTDDMWNDYYSINNIKELIVKPEPKKKL